MNGFVVAIPGREHIVEEDVLAHSWTVTDGCLVFLDAKGNRGRAFATGNWLEVAPA
jgi:hypothetical protein